MRKNRANKEHIIRRLLPGLCLLLFLGACAVQAAELSPRLLEQPVEDQAVAPLSQGEETEPLEAEEPSPDDAIPDSEDEAAWEEDSNTSPVPAEPAEEDVPEEEPFPGRPMNPDLEEYIANGDKLVALTFDDGPHPVHTKRLLEILEGEEVCATFFLVGINMELSPETVELIVQGGHQIGNHTYNHVRLSKLEEEERQQEIEDAAQLIEKMTGYPPVGLRPPFLDLSDEVREDAVGPIILWSVDPEDWKTKNSTTVYNRVMDGVEDGAIVLMHDVYGTSVDAAARIIPALKKKGYRFVTVDELIYARMGDVEDGEEVRRCLP